MESNCEICMHKEKCKTYNELPKDCIPTYCPAYHIEGHIYSYEEEMDLFP